MVFAHDTRDGIIAAVALVNSAVEPDTLVDTSQLSKFLHEHGYTGRIDGNREELKAVRRLRPVLRQLLTSSVDEAVPMVNSLLREANACPQLVRHGDVGWHIHAVDGEQPLAERIAVETAMAMADVIRMDETSRLGICCDPTCDGLVFDLSRNRSRRFCSVACSNRSAVYAYRARQSG